MWFLPALGRAAPGVQKPAERVDEGVGAAVRRRPGVFDAVGFGAGSGQAVDRLGDHLYAVVVQVSGDRGQAGPDITRPEVQAHLGRGGALVQITVRVDSFQDAAGGPLQEVRVAADRGIHQHLFAFVARFRRGFRGDLAHRFDDGPDVFGAQSAVGQGVGEDREGGRRVGCGEVFAGQYLPGGLDPGDAVGGGDVERLS